MRGFKKFSRKEVSSDIVPEARNQVQTGYVSGNSKHNSFFLPRKSVVMICGLMVFLLIFSVGALLMTSGLKIKQHEVNIKKLDEITKKNANKKEVSTDDIVSGAKDVSTFWKDEGDCSQADLTAKNNAMLLYSEDSRRNKAKSLEILDNVIKICSNNAPASQALRDLIIGEEG